MISKAKVKLVNILIHILTGILIHINTYINSG